MQVELQSASLMGSVASSGRPTLKGTVDRGFSGPRRYQVFGFGKGFLFLDIGKVPMKKGAAGGMWGGLLGGAVGSAIGSAIEKSLANDFDAPENTYEHKSNDELLAMAKRSKHSFVVATDEIKWLKVQKAGLLADKECVGSVTLKEPSVGKVTIEITDLDSMMTAIEAFPAALGDRAKVKVRLNETTLKFESK